MGIPFEHWRNSSAFGGEKRNGIPSIGALPNGVGQRSEKVASYRPRRCSQVGKFGLPRFNLSRPPLSELTNSLSKLQIRPYEDGSLYRKRRIRRFCILFGGQQNQVSDAVAKCFCLISI